MKFFFKRRSAGNGQAGTVPVPETEKPCETETCKQEEIAAVISLALHKYLQQARAYEDAVITLKKFIKPYSPWSSKIYGLRQPPVHCITRRNK